MPSTNSSRRQTAVLALAAVAAALLVPASLFPATSLAAAGALDHSFNGTGRLVIKAPDYTYTGRDNPFEVTRLSTPWMLSAPGPKGELVVAYARRVLRYRADGHPQKRFSGDGRAAIPIPAGMSFQLAGVAVDSRGRVLVAGTTEPAGATGGTEDARVSVYRFMANGKLDRGFGRAGVAGAWLGPVEATGLAVDSRDRPVLTGISALTPSHCNKTPVYLNTTVVARLTAGGGPDPTFGGGSGAYTDPLEDAHLPALTAGGRVVYASAPEHRCAGFDGVGPVGAPVASILTPGGSLALRVPSGLEVTSLAVDRQNRIVMLETSNPPEGDEAATQLVRRLLPDGSPDPEFGGQGQYSQAGTVGAPDPPGGFFDAVTTDARNRIVLAGTAMRREGKFVARRFLAVRMNAAGATQRWFGEAGVVTVRIGKEGEAGATQVYLDSRGRIVLSGTVSAPWIPGRSGFAFARLLSGSR